MPGSTSYSIRKNSALVAVAVVSGSLVNWTDPDHLRILLVLEGEHVGDRGNSEYWPS